MSDGIKIVLVIALVLVVIHFGISAFTDCYDNSRAETFLGKLQDCGG